MKLTGRTILITGGSAGIGLAFALKFAELGNEVIVTGRRQAVLDALKAKHPKLHTIQSDAADPAQIAALAARVKADFPKLDVLMNNAGIMVSKNLTAPAADLTALMVEMDVNVGGAMTSALIDLLIANRGTVINVSSGLAFVPVPAAPVYSAPKAAVHSYTQSLRFQLEDTDVDVIELMPPGVRTDMTTELVEGGISLDHHRRVGEAVLCVSQGGRAGDPAWAIQTAGVYAAPRSQFHQQATLEGFY